VLGPRPSHADDSTPSFGLPSGQCTDTGLASRLAWQSAVIDAPLSQLAHHESPSWNSSTRP